MRLSLNELPGPTYSHDELCYADSYTLPHLQKHIHSHRQVRACTHAYIHTDARLPVPNQCNAILELRQASMKLNTPNLKQTLHNPLNPKPETFLNPKP